MMCFQKVKNPGCTDSKSTGDQYLWVFCPILPVSKRKKNCIYAVSREAQRFQPHWSLPLDKVDKDDNGATLLKHLKPLSSHFFMWLRVRAVQCWCIAWALQLTPLLLYGLVLISCTEQVYKHRQSEVLVHWCSCQGWGSCKLLTSPLEPHVLVCLSSMLYALLDSDNFSGDRQAALLFSKFNSCL